MKTKRTLLEITEDLAALDDLLAEVGGDVSNPNVAEAIEDWMSELDSNLSTKADNYAALISELRLRAESRASEAERLARRAKADEASADFLQSRLLQAFEERGLRKVETERYTLSIVGNGGKAPLILDLDVPADWTRTVTKTEPDRERIRACLESGQALPFATLGERGRRLSIR
jgi:hypothetical protein